MSGQFTWPAVVREGPSSLQLVAPSLLFGKGLRALRHRELLSAPFRAVTGRHG
jgi:hypothetical protein